jgi:hypothetical protein
MAIDRSSKSGVQCPGRYGILPALSSLPGVRPAPTACRSHLEPIMTKSIAFVAAVALVSTLTVASATTANAACRARVSGTGSGQGALGKGTEKARTAATLQWEGKAKSRHGSRFASLSKASDVKWDCKSTILKATCVVSAKPCN